MKTATIPLYRFEELNEKAKIRAIEEERQAIDEDYALISGYLCDEIYYTLHEDGLIKETGFEIDDKDVHYSLNHCQGDGVSFTTDTIDIERALIYYSATVYGGEKLVDEIQASDKYTTMLDNCTFEITQSYCVGNYVHKYTVSCNVISDYDNDDDDEDTSYNDLLDKVCYVVNEVKNSICDLLEKRLYAVLDDRTSEECIIDSLTNNGYYFMASGERWKY